jgi:RNA polymerase sigma factor (sigma-70 family)
VQRYRGPLLRYCSRLLSPTRAEDAVQQAFLSAHRAIHAGDAELNLRPWLYRIAHNASLNLLRQTGYDHDEVSEEIDGVETPPQAFERGERLRTVVAAVQDLPERQRSAIVLQAVEGRSYDEIAGELGVSDGAVRQLLNRARNTLREAAAALTPAGLLARIGSSAAEAPVAERIATAVAGSGGAALLAKAGATLVVAGAVAGGAATGTLPGTGGGGHRHAAAAVPSAPQTADKARVRLVDGRGSSGGGSASRGHYGVPSRGQHDGVESRTSSRGDRHGGGRSDDSSGSRDSHSGGGGDHSSSGGRSGSSDDHSGSGGGGGGGDDGGTSGSTEHSGSGSGDGGGSTSGGSGSGGSDDGGSLNLGSGTSGSGTSGSGTSGSGSSDSGSGSSDSGSDDGMTSDSGRDRSGSSSGSDDPLDSHSGSSH